MTWNYRLFKQDTPKSAEGEHLFFVAECYYDKDGKPELHSTMEHNLLSGDTQEETRQTYEQIHDAFTTPVIELDEEGEFKSGK